MSAKKRDVFAEQMAKAADDHVQQQEEEDRLARKAQRMARIRLGLLAVMLGALGFYGYKYRAEIKTGLDSITGADKPKELVYDSDGDGIPDQPESKNPQVRAMRKATSQIRDIKAEADRRNALMGTAEGPEDLQPQTSE